MECPKCGAENPEGATHCNLCFHSYIERPPEPEPEPERPAAAGKPKPKAVLAGIPLDLSLKGAVAGLVGGWLFLASLTVIHISGVRVFDFMFSSLGTNLPNVQLMILFLSVFSLFTGGIAVNLDDKREIVPVVRTVAALIGLGLWAGIVIAFKPADTSLIVWLTEGAGIGAALASLPLIAATLGSSESFGDEMDLWKSLKGAAAGFAAGTASALIVGAAYLVVPVFGSAAPAGALPVIGFSLKMLIITGVTGFASGGLLWLAVAATERYG